MQSQTSANSTNATSAGQTYRPLEQLLPTQWTETTIVANSIRQHFLRSGGHILNRDRPFVRYMAAVGTFLATYNPP